MTGDATPGMSSSRKLIRVLHVLEATGGGTMRYMENIAKATEGLNIVSAFAYGIARADCRLFPFLNDIKTRGWQTFAVDMRREIEVRRDARAVIELRRVVKAFRPDIIHTHSSKAGAIGRAAASIRFQHPVRLYSPHAIAAPLGSKYLKIEKALAHVTDRFIAVSESERRQIASLALAKPNSIDVIYPSIDADYYKPALRTVALSFSKLESRPTVVALGRLTAQKNPAAFVSIMEELHRIRPDARGVWVGSGEDEKLFLDKIRAAHLEDVISLVPWADDVRRFIAEADVFVSTSKFESFGYVTAEALAMQRPVVATNVTGTCDIMQGELKEWLFELGDHRRAAELIARLMDDPSLAERVAKMGRSRVLECFSTEVMRESVRQVYTSALQHGGVEQHAGPEKGRDDIRRRSFFGKRVVQRRGSYAVEAGHIGYKVAPESETS